jgi:hypothetical protein
MSSTVATLWQNKLCLFSWLVQLQVGHQRVVLWRHPKHEFLLMGRQRSSRRGMDPMGVPRNHIQAVYQSLLATTSEGRHSSHTCSSSISCGFQLVDQANGRLLQVEEPIDLDHASFLAKRPFEDQP